MILKIVSDKETNIIDNIKEINYKRLKAGHCSEDVNKSPMCPSSWYGDNKKEKREEGELVVRFFATRSNGYSSSVLRDYIFEYHIIYPSAIAYLLNDEGKTIERITVD